MSAAGDGAATTWSLDAQRAASSAAWQPSTWRGLPATQDPRWPDAVEVRDAGRYLASKPGLVTASEIGELRRALARAALGGGFVVQAGDCAETFDRPTFERVAAQVAMLQRAARTVADSLRLPVVPIGRIAGQYGKPRSSPVEQVGSHQLPAFRGVIVNGPEPTSQARTPDPSRLLLAYRHASEVHAVLRELAERGSSMPGRWGRPLPGVWTSHEALILDFEEPFVRRDRHGRWLLRSTHLPWVGARTNQPMGAHVAFLSGIANPVACKVSADTTPEDLAELVEVLDPDRQPGRLLLIARLGAEAVEARLPALAAAVTDAGSPAMWLCDPMHGNTVRSASGHKTRYLQAVVDELVAFFRVLRGCGAWPAGVHLEATPDEVTECVGGTVSEVDLGLRYTTACDPRLNGRQTEQVVRVVADLCRQR